MKMGAAGGKPPNERFISACVEVFFSSAAHSSLGIEGGKRLGARLMMQEEAGG